MDSESKMNILRETMLTPRLVSAFMACAIITLAIGLIAYTGIGSLKSNIDNVIGNNLVSVYKTSNSQANSVAH